MNGDFERVKLDLAAFADDDEEIVVDRTGQCLFFRGGREYNLTLRAAKDGGLLVDYEGSTVPYRRFLSHELANLPALAERILTKRTPVDAYIDSGACLDSPATERLEASGLELLRQECLSPPPFASRVAFITADAGQGKTALLRQFQHVQAERFLHNRSPFVFWHVDLQGRQLLRLSEALMGDLGELRVSGLWMSAIITLLQHRVLVLAIDGFDELAAEQGSSDALGALALLVQQIGTEGTIVAASRRTFFDTDDYIRRAGLFGRAGATDSEFDQILLRTWNSDDGQSYFKALELGGRRFQEPDAVYDEIVTELGDPAHPMVTRPFLLAQVARGLLLYDASPADFIRGMEDPLRGVGAVIEAFVKREVSEKWKQKDTGEPFLSAQQHLQLLADVAEEMFRSQRATIEIDVLETITTLLLEEWGITPALRQQILEMVRMHVLLTPDEDFNLRRFDHEQFQDWFTAYALRERLLAIGSGESNVSQSLLGLAHLSDATAQYVCTLIDRTFPTVQEILTGLGALLGKEWRPGYLQMNVGTLVPFLSDGVTGDGRLQVPSGAVYSSLVFEGRRLASVDFNGGTFINVSFLNVQWDGVTFDGCEFGEVAFDRHSRYNEVKLVDCHIEGIRLVDGDDEYREYAPERIALLLGELGIEVDEGGAVSVPDVAALPEQPLGDTRKLVQKVLNVFRRTTFMPESTIVRRFHHDANEILDEILPMMEEFGIVEARPWKGSGKQRAWGLPARLEEIEKADGEPASIYYQFWRAIDNLDEQRASK
jgi:hypothetical protein